MGGPLRLVPQLAEHAVRKLNDVERAEIVEAKRQNRGTQRVAATGLHAFEEGQFLQGLQEAVNRRTRNVELLRDFGRFDHRPRAIEELQDIESTLQPRDRDSR